MRPTPLPTWLMMEFPERLVHLRKHKQLTQQADERDPGDDLRQHFEAVARMSPEEQQVVRSLLEGMILKHDAGRWHSRSSS